MNECIEPRQLWDAAWSGLATGAAIWVFLTVRLRVVYSARKREIDAAQGRAQADIDAGREDWKRHYLAFEKGPAALRQMADLTKWTHADFYPPRHD